MTPTFFDSLTRLTLPQTSLLFVFLLQNFTQYWFHPFVPQTRVHLNLDKRFSGWNVQSVHFSCTNLHSYLCVGNSTFYIYIVYDFISQYFLFLLVYQPPLGQGLLIHEVSISHTTTHHSRWDSSGRVISSSHRPLPDNTQHSQTDGHPCCRWDSNPQSQQASGRRPMP